MIKRFTLVFAVLFTALCFVLPLHAQDEDAGTAAVVIYIEANPGEGGALEDAIREYHYWIADKPGAFRYTWYAVDTGPHTGKYIARSGNHNWSDFDVVNDWQDEADAKFAELVAPHVKSVERHLTEEMTDFAYWPESFEDYSMFQVTNWYIKGGHYGKFQAGLRKIHAALTEGGFPSHYGFHETVSGGHGNEVALVLPMKGHADFGENDPSFTQIMSEALGGEEEFGAFMADWSSTYKVGGSMLVRYLPDASDYGDSE